MSASIVQPANFSASKCSISQPKSLDSGAKMSYLNYAEGRSLVMQTPSLPSPFGFSVFDKPGMPVKYSFNISMRGYQDNAKVKAFYNALNELDEWMIDQGLKNAKQWFPSVKNVNRDIIAAFYTPCVKVPMKDGNPLPYPPELKLTLKKKRDTDEFDVSFYDAQAKPIKGVPVEEILVKRVEVTCLIQVASVWFGGGKYGISWKPVQVRLDVVPSGGINGYGFAGDDGEAEGEQSSSKPTIKEPSEFGGAPKKPVIEDSEEEDEDEEVPPPPPVTKANAVPQQTHEEDDEGEEEHAPAPVPKKTIVTKKKVITTAKPK